MTEDLEAGTATLETDTRFADVALEKEGFREFDTNVYMARIRYRYKVEGSDDWIGYLEDRMCCYLKPIGNVRVAASYFTRFLVQLGLRPTTNIIDLVRLRRSRDAEKLVTLTPVDGGG